MKTLQLRDGINHLGVMVEAIAGVATAIITGAAVLAQKLHTRISDLDKRVDQVELRMAEQYVTKADLTEMINRVEASMIRIEDKLDRLTFGQ